VIVAVLPLGGIAALALIALVRTMDVYNATYEAPVVRELPRAVAIPTAWRRRHW
jgi:hypothetical protein